MFYLLKIMICGVLLMQLSNCQDQIKMIMGLVRHGARMPNSSIPNLPRPANVFEQNGDLTATGMRQEFNLGRMLRSKYPEVLPDTFEYNSLNITASSLKRTIASGMSQISGIYYKIDGVKKDTPKNPELYTPPWIDRSEIPKDDPTDDFALPNGVVLQGIHTTDGDTNFLFKADQTCRTVENASIESFDKTDKETFNRFQEAYAIFNRNGFSIKHMYGENTDKKENFANFAEISDALTGILYLDPADRVGGKLTFDQQAHMIFINSLYNYNVFVQNNQRKLYLTKLLSNWRDILRDMRSAKTSDDLAKVQLFMGHGENLAALILELHDDKIVDKIWDQYERFKSRASQVQDQNGFNSFSQNINQEMITTDISYASSFILEVLLPEEDENSGELSEDEDSLSVRMVFNGQPLEFKGLGVTEISLDRFIDILSKIIQPKFDKSCGNPVFESRDINHAISIILYILLVLNIICLLLFIYYFVRVRKITKQQKMMSSNSTSEKFIS